MNIIHTNTLKAYLSFLALFLVIDAAWISLYGLHLYQDQVSHLIAEKPRMAIAVIFYLAYAAAAVRLVVQPSNSMATASVNGAVFGATAYGTYAVTNYTMLSEWTLTLMIVDTIWGALITCACCALGFKVSSNT